MESFEAVFKNWTKLDIGGTLPPVRQGHAIAVVNDRAYLFGGSAVSDDSYSLFYNDLYCFQLSSDSGSQHFWELIEQSGDVPSGREGHSLIVVDNDLYLLGGVESDGAAECARGLYILNTETHYWSRADMSGDIPQAQSSTTILTNDKRIVTFGGVLKGKACNDTFIMDVVSRTWERPEITGTKPQSRCDHGCVVLENKMYIYGGSGGESLWFNDLCYLDLDKMQWVTVETSGQPCPRDYPSLLAINTQAIQLLIVFGGFTGFDGKERSLNDTHYLSLGYDVSWSPVTIKDLVLPEVRYGHTAFIYNNKLYVQGGQNEEIMLNDVWVLDITIPQIKYSPTVPPRRTYITNVPIPSPRKVLPPAASKEFDKQNFEELRSQYIDQIGGLFDLLTQKFQEHDEMEAKLKAEREQFEMEKQEHYEIYDKQQQELQELRDQHKRDNEEWIQSLRLENDQNRKEIAEEKVKLTKERNDLEAEKLKFTEKSTKLDNIMKQVQGLR